MEAFNQVMGFLQSGVTAYGTYSVIFGFMKLSEAMKQKTSQDFQEGAGQLVAGAMILLCAYLLSTIKIG